MSEDRSAGGQTQEGRNAQSTALGPAVRLKRYIGYSLLVISTLTWVGGLFVAPFVPLPAAKRVALAGFLIATAEITFWVSIPFLGKGIVAAFRKWMNPFRWFKRKPAEGAAEEAAD